MSLPRLAARAKLYQTIRQFFAQKGVMEVEVPLLGFGAATDPGLSSCAVNVNGSIQYLQTSPEFFLKRLLVEGAGPIYTLTKAFRNEEQGHRHRPEFTMLEWYRPGFSLGELIDEVLELVCQVVPGLALHQFTYRELFEQHLGVNPHQANLSELAHLAESYTGLKEDLNREGYLDLLMSHCVEPKLNGATIVTDFPASQAALARIEEASGDRVAKRFELYLAGVEIANGYWELTDPVEQLQRFQADNHKRSLQGLPPMPIDYDLVESLKQGMPDCSGVALGVDRLLMHMMNTSNIADVLAF